MIVSKPVGAENTPQSDACMCRASTGVKVANNYVYMIAQSVLKLWEIWLKASVGWISLDGPDPVFQWLPWRLWGCWQRKPVVGACSTVLWPRERGSEGGCHFWIVGQGAFWLTPGTAISSSQCPPSVKSTRPLIILHVKVALACYQSSCAHCWWCFWIE